MGERRFSGGAAFSSRTRRSTRSTSLKKKSSPKKQIKKSVNELIACELLGIAKTVKRSNITFLSLYQKHASLLKRKAENRKLGFLGQRHSETLLTFSRAISWALSGGGYLQQLELGFPLWERDLKIIAESLCHSTTLKHLSFANSEFGDHSLQILGKSLQECPQLEILNISACALTDGVASLLSTVLKAHVCRKADADWQASLRCFESTNERAIRPKGLVALDISFNQLSDVAVQTICGSLRIGTPLEALNLRGNQLSRLSGKLLLDVVEEWGILRFVDLRDNVDNRLMSVLEDGQHLTAFSRMQPPFWLSSPVIKSKRPCYKTGGRKLRERNELKSNKSTYQINNYLQRCYSRPYSSPSTLIPGHQLRGQYCKSVSESSEYNRRNTSVRKGMPCLRVLNTRPSQPMKRPSTSLGKSQLNTGKKQVLSSRSTSPEFSAWDYDESNAKESKCPYDMNLVWTVSEERGMACEEPRTNAKKNVSLQGEDSVVLRQTDMTKLYPSGGNIDNRPHERAKLYPRQPTQSNPQMGSITVASSEIPGVKVEHLKGKDEYKKGTVTEFTMQRNEWHSFLKEITQVISHLQERLDDVFGPPDSSSFIGQTVNQNFTSSCVRRL
ncbi:hypothetical protein KP509_24G006300 [Ceratopteris richardii]|uniref:Uncharacterized protein n=1 Tax=Ceratopteris richardii TaxID=49495 RepID=A0A8T2RT21_CERRI|nr:hypothetical protein KP509_24G006300 [Ceratopteris richardii]